MSKSKTVATKDSKVTLRPVSHAQETTTGPIASSLILIIPVFLIPCTGPIPILTFSKDMVRARRSLSKRSSILIRHLRFEVSGLKDLIHHGASIGSDLFFFAVINPIYLFKKCYSSISVSMHGTVQCFTVLHLEMAIALAPAYTTAP